MHVRVLNLLHVVRIPVVREPSEAGAIEINDERLVAGTECVDSHVKLLAANQQRVHDVPLHDIGLGLGTFWLPSKVVLPLGDLCKLVE